MVEWFLELWRFRELLIALTVREIKIRYKQTYLGALWAILQPASLTLIFTLVFGIFLGVQTSNIPYPVFAYSALVPWVFFSNSISFGSLSVVNNGNLVTKVYFPREILPLSSIGAAFFDFLMASFVFVFLMLFYGIEPSVYIFLIFLLVPSIFFLTTGIAFIFSTINVLYRDIKFVIPLVLQIWLFVTPVMYSSTQIPDKYQFFIKINPMVSLIENFRLVTTSTTPPVMLELLISTITSFIVFVLGYYFFKANEKVFADVM